MTAVFTVDDPNTQQLAGELEFRVAVVACCILLYLPSNSVYSSIE